MQHTLNNMQQPAAPDLIALNSPSYEHRVTRLHRSCKLRFVPGPAMGPSKRQAVVADAATSEAPAAAGGNADDRWAPAAVAHTTYNCHNMPTACNCAPPLALVSDCQVYSSHSSAAVHSCTAYGASAHWW
jgi:hypothetical protein